MSLEERFLVQAGGGGVAPAQEPLEAPGTGETALETLQELANSGMKVSWPHDPRGRRVHGSCAAAQPSNAARLGMALELPASPSWCSRGEQPPGGEVKAAVDELAELERSGLKVRRL